VAAEAGDNGDRRVRECSIQFGGKNEVAIHSENPLALPQSIAVLLSQNLIFANQPDGACLSLSEG